MLCTNSTSFLSLQWKDNGEVEDLQLFVYILFKLDLPI